MFNALARRKEKPKKSLLQLLCRKTWPQAVFHSCRLTGDSNSCPPDLKLGTLSKWLASPLQNWVCPLDSMSIACCLKWNNFKHIWSEASYAFTYIHCSLSEGSSFIHTVYFHCPLSEGSPLIHISPIPAVWSESFYTYNIYLLPAVWSESSYTYCTYISTPRCLKWILLYILYICTPRCLKCILPSPRRVTGQKGNSAPCSTPPTQSPPLWITLHIKPSSSKPIQRIEHLAFFAIHPASSQSHAIGFLFPLLSSLSPSSNLKNLCIILLSEMNTVWMLHFTKTKVQ